MNARLKALAASQYGLLTRAQLTAHGVTPAMLRTQCRRGWFEQVAPAVFRIVGSPPSWLQQLMEASLAWGGGSAVSHRAAQALWHLEGAQPDHVELTVPRNRNRSYQRATIHRPRSLLPSDIATRFRIPVTTVGRTIIDLAELLMFDELEQVLDDAMHRGLVTLARLRLQSRTQSGPGQNGSAKMKALIASRSGLAIAHSELERQLRSILFDRKIPGLVAQHPVKVGGRLVGIVDFAIPAAKVAIECDSYRWHGSRLQWQRDLARRNEMSALGWIVIHATWADLEHPERLVAKILRAAGLPGARAKK